ncbi:MULTISPECIES: GrpB family protein [unclassified Sporolactobacillus]|uniref:GrpB family protein n=1 Tax=unclassified Sporolactobacillus TaxID=2628533 RepID=UPI0023675A4A|nr:GrpB family protein [Sporolactobacillus sp. CQH2019]MDD9149537.1 GrpB family protein [Sporolactobacillus sp. CQH2019]
MRHVVVVPFRDEWKRTYEKEAGRLSHTLHPLITAVHHIGGTAVPGMAAQPTIDLLAEVGDLNEVDKKNEAMAKIGYRAFGEHGIRGRRYFCKTDAEDNHLAHVHIFSAGSEEVIRHLAFRDYLASHEEDADFYGRLKLELAAQFPYDIESYRIGKNAAAEKIENLALQWWYSE